MASDMKTSPQAWIANNANYIWPLTSVKLLPTLQETVTSSSATGGGCIIYQPKSVGSVDESALRWCARPSDTISSGKMTAFPI